MCSSATLVAVPISSTVAHDSATFKHLPRNFNFLLGRSIPCSILPARDNCSSPSTSSPFPLCDLARPCVTVQYLLRPLQTLYSRSKTWIGSTVRFVQFHCAQCGMQWFMHDGKKSSKQTNKQTVRIDLHGNLHMFTNFRNKFVAKNTQTVRLDPPIVNFQLLSC